MKSYPLLLAVIAIMLTAGNLSCKKDSSVSSPANELKKTPQRPPDYFNLPPNGTLINMNFSNGKSIDLYKVDSSYIWQRDIVLTDQQVKTLSALNESPANIRTYITDLTKYWPGGNIYYSISSSFSASDQNTILYSMNDWALTVGGIHFIQKTNQSNYIQFNKNNSVENSNVGMTGGGQTINLKSDPTFGVSFTDAEHEIGHALGLFHEQSRGDRNNYIQVNYSNIKPAYAHDFDTYIQQGVPGTEFGTFDFNSIMLYPSIITDDDFVYNTTIPTMTTISGSTWGSNYFISGGDAETVALIYGPPYARLEFDLVDDTEDQDDVVLTYDIYVDFYADEACTTPYTLPGSKTIHYKITETDYEYSQSNTTSWDNTLTLNGGSNRYLIDGDVSLYERHYDYGNIHRGWDRDYTLLDAFKR